MSAGLRKKTLPRAQRATYSLWLISVFLFVGTMLLQRKFDAMLIPAALIPPTFSAIILSAFALVLRTGDSPNNLFEAAILSAMHSSITAATAILMRDSDPVFTLSPEFAPLLAWSEPMRITALFLAGFLFLGISLARARRG